MNKIEQTVEEYLSNPTKLYQDWYTGFNQIETEEKQYAIKVGVSIPPVDKIKALFDDWFNESQKFLKDKLCGEWAYCQKKEEFAQHEAQSIAILADFLSLISPIPINTIATATILRVEKYLDRLCECE